jgi:hypothetical protein
MRNKCAICGTNIGTGCGCCSDDFPEQYGYCDKCFDKSNAYIEKTQNINALLDRLDIGGCNALLAFFETYDCDFERIYIKLTNNKINSI